MDHNQEQMKITTVHVRKKTFAQIIFNEIKPFAVGFIAIIACYLILTMIVESPDKLFIGSYDSTQASPTNLLDYLLLKFITVAAVTDFCFLYNTTLLYIIACLHTCQEFCVYVTFLAYYVIVFGALSFSNAAMGETVFDSFCLICALHFTGSLFLFSLTLIPSTVFTDLETCYRIKSMVDAIDPINRKKKVAFTIFFALHGILAGVVCMDMALIGYYDGHLAIFWRLMIGIVTGVLLLIGFLLIIVVQRVSVVCESFHKKEKPLMR